MDFDTTSTTVRRDTKTTTLSQVALFALASTAAMMALDPENTKTFTSHSETANADGSITVSLVVETEVTTTDAATAPAVSPSSPATPVPQIPMGIGAPVPTA